MKSLKYVFWGLGMMLIWSCSDNESEALAIDLCSEDYAEYSYNGTLFRTTHLPEEGEFLTTSGESCGISAVIDTTANVLTMHILGEGQHINLRVDVATNEEVGFSRLEYTTDNMDSTFDNLISDHQNYILIEELDPSEKTIIGRFNFKIENSIGDIMNVTNGVFNCSYHEF